eukprot:Rmarinus@m.7281
MMDSPSARVPQLVEQLRNLPTADDARLVCEELTQYASECQTRMAGLTSAGLPLILWQTVSMHASQLDVLELACPLLYSMVRTGESVAVSLGREGDIRTYFDVAMRHKRSATKNLLASLVGIAAAIIAADKHAALVARMSGAHTKLLSLVESNFDLVSITAPSLSALAVYSKQDNGCIAIGKDRGVVITCNALYAHIHSLAVVLPGTRLLANLLKVDRNAKAFLSDESCIQVVPRLLELHHRNEGAAVRLLELVRSLAKAREAIATMKNAGYLKPVCLCWAHYLDKPSVVKIACYVVLCFTHGVHALYMPEFKRIVPSDELGRPMRLVKTNPTVSAATLPGLDDILSRGVDVRSPSVILPTENPHSTSVNGSIPVLPPEPLLKPRPAVMRERMIASLQRVSGKDGSGLELAGGGNGKCGPVGRLVYDSTDVDCNGRNATSASRCSTSDLDLQFESRFEAGNLWRATRVATDLPPTQEQEYDLILHTDYNNHNHAQWFYFSVRNMQPGVQYRFNIINMFKSNSQFNYGMRPVMFSKVAHQEQGKGWYRAGDECCYYPNVYVRDPHGGSREVTTAMGTTERSSKEEKSGRRSTHRDTSAFLASVSTQKTVHFYTAAFTLTFPHEDDTCWLAYHFPYTYTQLQTDLAYLCASVSARSCFTLRENLCSTLAGNRCDVLTITARENIDTARLAGGNGIYSDACNIRNRKYIVLTSRVHPGESNSSWLMRGVLKMLLGATREAKELREKFIFKIVPMLNPDGVIVGHTRCNLAGLDLNRQWPDPSRLQAPTIHAAKEMIRTITDTGGEVLLFCDMHGHSRKKNVFIFGNDNVRSDDVRVLPWMLSKSSPCFDFDSCLFKTQRQKESTGRAVVWRELNITFSYTIEATYNGMSIGPYRDQHVSQCHLEDVGKRLCCVFSDLGSELKVAEANAELQKYDSKSSAPGAGGVRTDRLPVSDCDKGPGVVVVAPERPPRLEFSSLGLSGRSSTSGGKIYTGSSRFGRAQSTPSLVNLNLSCPRSGSRSSGPSPVTSPTSAAGATRGSLASSLNTPNIISKSNVSSEGYYACSTTTTTTSSASLSAAGGSSANTSFSSSTTITRAGPGAVVSYTHSSSKKSVLTRVTYTPTTSAPDATPPSVLRSRDPLSEDDHGTGDDLHPTEGRDGPTPPEGPVAAASHCTHPDGAGRAGADHSGGTFGGVVSGVSLSSPTGEAPGAQADPNPYTGRGGSVSPTDGAVLPAGGTHTAHGPDSVPPVAISGLGVRPPRAAIAGRRSSASDSSTYDMDVGVVDGPVVTSATSATAPGRNAHVGGKPAKPKPRSRRSSPFIGAESWSRSGNLSSLSSERGESGTLAGGTVAMATGSRRNSLSRVSTGADSPGSVVSTTRRKRHVAYGRRTTRLPT